ncbi:MAG: hypothetical protein ACM3ON_01175 [Chloroflexota bacterium]
MKRICAWCNTELGTHGSEPDADSVITHGICRRCCNDLMRRAGVELDTYLDSLPAPILVVGSDGMVATANRRARILLGKDLPAIRGYPGGLVFECAYARQPEGCGNTVHCSGCAIRRTVMATIATGDTFSRIPAYLNQEKGAVQQKLHFFISTEKAGDVVLLRIEEIRESDETLQCSTAAPLQRGH